MSSRILFLNNKTINNLLAVRSQVINIITNDIVYTQFRGDKNVL